MLAALRIIDAAANRASEGLRTMEEFARFVLEDRFLSESMKQLRHDLCSALQSVAMQDRLSARTVTSDIGTEIETPSEMSRPRIEDVVNAAAARSQEAIRCLEEYGKTIPSLDCRQLQSLRYRSYTLASALLMTAGRVARLQDSRVYLLMAPSGDAANFAGQLEALFTSGVDVIQIRDKSLGDRRFYEYAKIAAATARRLAKLFIVNDRPDIAAACDASGVHVGQDELPVEAVRRIVGPDRLIGVSTHNIDQARAAVLDGADYIGCGPTFPSGTKTFDSFTGIEFLDQVVGNISLPAYAIGGIDRKNLPSVLPTGVHGVAVSAGILSAADPLRESSWFNEQFKNRQLASLSKSSTSCSIATSDAGE